jgi:hypothetical protein
VELDAVRMLAVKRHRRGGIIQHEIDRGSWPGVRRVR